MDKHVEDKIINKLNAAVNPVVYVYSYLKTSVKHNTYLLQPKSGACCGSYLSHP